MTPEYLQIVSNKQLENKIKSFLSAYTEKSEDLMSQIDALDNYLQERYIVDICYENDVKQITGIRHPDGEYTKFANNEEAFKYARMKHGYRP